jgi:ribose 5-phosphate isomerase B
MKIALGSDHRGDSAAKFLHNQLQNAGHDVLVLGECHGMPCDYPDQAYAVAQAVSHGQAQRGILICGSGIGVSIAANKVPGVRAALVFDELAAALSRSHNDANVLCLSADTTPTKELLAIVNTWLKTGFDGGRHERRVRKIQAIEQGQDPTTLVWTDSTQQGEVRCG